MPDLPGLPEVAARVAAARVAYLERCYADLGLSPELAKTHAVLAYAAYRGLLQLAHEAPDALPDDWTAYPEAVKKALIPDAQRAAIATRRSGRSRSQRSR